MKVAYVVPMTWACGGILAPFNQVNGLVRRGHEVTVFAPQAEPLAWFRLDAPLCALPASADQATLYDAAVFVGDSFRLPHHLKPRRRFLLLQGKDYLRTSGAARAALLRAYADPGNHILAVSNWLADFVREKCGNDRVTVVGNGIDPRRFFPDPQPRVNNRVLIEGAFPDAVKNTIDALEVAARVRQHHSIEIWALGRRFVHPGILIDRIFEDPPQDQIPKIYRECDLLIKTSVMEGFGLPHLEAMACGCVPATYASGGLSDFCRHNENSLVTGVGNIPQLVGHILRFLSDASLRERLRQGGLATARALTWEHSVDRIEEVLQRELRRSS